MKKVIFIFVFPIFCLFWYANAQAPTYSQITGLRTGFTNTIHSQLIPVQTQSFSIIYPSPLSLLVGAVNFNSGLGLVGFDTYSSCDFCFQSTIIGVDEAKLVIELTSCQISYLQMMNFHYIVSYTLSNSIYFYVWQGCFFCTSLTRGSGARSESFSIANNQGSVQSGNIKIHQVISGLSLINKQGTYLAFATKAFMDIGSTIINVTIYTQESNLIHEICLTFILINANYPMFQNLVYLYEMVDISVTGTGSTLIPTLANSQNEHFYGISYFKISIDGFSKQLNLQTNGTATNLADLSNNFGISSNIQIVNIKRIIFYQQSCPISKYFSLSSPTVCLSSCPSSQLLIAVSQTCLACHITCQTCGDTTINGCATCNAAILFRARSNTLATYSSCICQSGHIESNTVACPLCSSFIMFCSSCSSQTTCISCVSPFITNSSTGLCDCPAGPIQYFYINSTCSPTPGCINAFSNSSGSYCTACNTLKHFQYQSNSCTCITHFVLSNYQCIDKCGDGFVFNSSCDDNNNVNFDGCNSNCQVEQGFYCPVDQNNLSICAPFTRFQLIYLYSEKDQLSCEVLMYFSINPQTTKISIDLTPLLSLSFSSSSQQVQFDPINNLIIISAVYHENLESKQQTVSFNFNSQRGNISTITSTFIMKGRNMQLIIESSGGTLIIKYISIALGILGFLIGLICSILGYKMIGLELLLPIQATFFSCYLSLNRKQVISPLIDLIYSNGYNFDYFAFFSSKRAIGLVDTHLSKGGVLNFNIMFAIFLILWLIYVIPEIKYNNIRFKEEMQYLNSGKDFDKNLSATTDRLSWHKIFIDRILFFFVTSITFQCIFYFCNSLLYSFQQNLVLEEYDFLFNNFSFCLVIVAVFQLNTLLLQDNVFEIENDNAGYVNNFLSVYLLIAIIISISKSLTYSIYICLIVMLVPMILVIKLNPYAKLICFNTFVTLLCQLIPLLAMLLRTILTKLEDNNQSFNIAVCSIILITIFLSQFLTVMRLVRQIKKKERVSREKYLKQQQQALVNPLFESIRNNLFNQQTKMMSWKMNNHLNDQKYEFDSANERVLYTKQQKQLSNDSNSENIEQEQEDEQLARLKRRLKNSFQEQRNNRRQ